MVSVHSRKLLKTHQGPYDIFTLNIKCDIDLFSDKRAGETEAAPLGPSTGFMQLFCCV